MSDTNQPIAVELHGQTLSITIGVAALRAAMLASYPADKVEAGKISIPDDYIFACQAVIALREGGNLPLGMSRALSVILAMASNYGTSAIVIEAD